MSVFKVMTTSCKSEHLSSEKAAAFSRSLRGLHLPAHFQQVQPLFPFPLTEVSANEMGTKMFLAQISLMCLVSTCEHPLTFNCI